MGQTIKNYVDPFVHATCDVVCQDIAGVAEALKTIGGVQPKTTDIIDKAIASFQFPAS